MKTDEQLKTLNKLYKESEHIYGDLAERLGMSHSTFWILYAISHSDEPIAQNDLCNEYFFPVQTVNSTISNLLKRELIKLEVIPGTRNRKKIIFTDKGKKFADETIGKADEIENRAFLRFTEEERNMYLSLFKRHIEYLRIEETRMLDSYSK